MLLPSRNFQVWVWNDRSDIKIFLFLFFFCRRYSWNIVYAFLLGNQGHSPGSLGVSWQNSLVSVLSLIYVLSAFYLFTCHSVDVRSASERCITDSVRICLLASCPFLQTDFCYTLYTKQYFLPFKRCVKYCIHFIIIGNFFAHIYHNYI